MPHSDTKASVEFLRRWKPEGPWVLTSIEIDRKAITTNTLKTEEEVVAWVDRFNGKRNIYFHVNSVMKDMSKKAEREDIKSLDWLHVDIDPRVDEDPAEEKVRALKLLREHVPPPTVIIDSGGGLQGFWRLSEPSPINGELKVAEELKLYNLQLERIFKADNCHNVDRIMRLPGTINIPDVKKRKKGRVEALASVIEFHDTAYALTDFLPAPMIQGADLGFGGEGVKVSGNIARIQSTDELPSGTPDWVKVLVVQGCDPENPDKYPSRSEMVFAAVCELIRCGTDDEMIYSILTDPYLGISASILEKKNSHQYAIRQIARAKEFAIDPLLMELNSTHAVIKDIGGKCRIISEIMDLALERPKISRQTFEDFRNFFINRNIQVGQNKDGTPLFKKAGAWWIEHPKRRQYDTMVFAPGREIPGAYNLWKGFACEARQGNCETFLKHIREVICDGNVAHFEYLIGWMARAVQHPDRQGEVAIVLRGRRGTGKSFFIREFGNLFGRHFLSVSDPKHLVGSFNAHLRDCVVLFCDEGFFAGDKKHESILKTLITEDTISIEAKGVDVETAPNYIHLLFASNDTWVVPAGSDERRFFVIDVSDKYMQDTKHFGALKEEMENGGSEALLHYLLQYDIKEYDVRKVPQTEALREQRLLSLSPEEEWWYQKLLEGRLLIKNSEWDGKVRKHELLADYTNHMLRVGVQRRATPTALGRFLARVCPTGFPKIYQDWDEEITLDSFGHEKTIKQRPYFYEFPDVEILRKYWDERHGSVGDWPVLVRGVTMPKEGPAKIDTPF